MIGSTVVLVIALALPGAEPPSYRPTVAELTQIREKTAALDRALTRLRADGADADLLLDVEVYHKAAEWILRYADEEFSTKRYAVVNSGHTFHETELRGNNALIYPRLGDFAVLRVTQGGSAAEPAAKQAGLFDDHWRLSR